MGGAGRDDGVGLSPDAADGSDWPDYSRTEHRKALGARLDGRSEGAIEFKHRNISTILDEQGLDHLVGYKTLANYQESLAREVLRQLAKHEDISIDLGVSTNGTIV